MGKFGGNTGTSQIQPRQTFYQRNVGNQQFGGAIVQIVVTQVHGLKITVRHHLQQLLNIRDSVPRQIQYFHGLVAKNCLRQIVGRALTSSSFQTPYAIPARISDLSSLTITINTVASSSHTQIFSIDGQWTNMDERRASDDDGYPIIQHNKQHHDD
jgi:hypothetical protein